LKKNMLITGGAGFVGSFLSEELLNRGYSVCAVDNLSTGKLQNVVHLKANPDFELVTGTIMNESLMDELVARAETVFHLAAAVGVRLIIERPVETIETNILGTEIIYKLVRLRKSTARITKSPSRKLPIQYTVPPLNRDGAMPAARRSTNFSVSLITTRKKCRLLSLDYSILSDRVRPGLTEWLFQLLYSRLFWAIPSPFLATESKPDVLPM